MKNRISLIGLILVFSIIFSGSVAQAWGPEEADLIVVGAGFSGMVAAVESADLGAKVLVLEKTNRVGGSVIVAGGSLSGANTMMQYEAGITHDSKEQFYADIFELGKGKHIPELAWHHVENAGKAVDYMDDLGVDFGDRQPGNSGYDPFSIDRQYMAVDGGMGYYYVMKEHLDNRIERGDVQLLFNTRAIDLIQEESGDVVGVVAENLETGELTDYYVKATILATGGYAANLDLIAKYNYENALTSALPHATGDGVIMAENIGAGFANMDYLPAYPGSIPHPERPGQHVMAANVDDYPGAIWVDLHGQRFTNEHDLTVGETQEVWANAPENTVFIVFDQKIRDENESILPGRDWEQFDELIAQSIVYKADTLTELAGQLEIDSAGLVAEVERYNGFVSNRNDLDFGRMELEYEIENGPFYGIKTIPYVLLTKGGPIMNTKAQILDANGKVIRGIYQTGELVGGANIGGHGSVGGLAHTINVVWSRTAAENATEYVFNQ